MWKHLIWFKKIKSQFRKDHVIPPATTIDISENEVNKFVLQNDTNKDNHNIDVQEFEKYAIFKEIYDKSAHWMRNIFSIQSGKIGKDLITEIQG